MQSIDLSTIIQPYSSVNLTRQTQILKRKSTDISAIPIMLYVKYVMQSYGRMNLLEEKINRIQVFSLCCDYGKVELPDSKEAPPTYLNLFRSTDSKSKYFINNIRRYNSMFSFTSMGGKVDASINSGKAPYIFKLDGQNYHRIGSLLPSKDLNQNSLSYTYMTPIMRNASTSTSNSIDLQIIHDLKHMLDSNNVLVQSYRIVRDCFHDNPHIDLKLCLIGKMIQDGSTYNLSSASEVVALIVGDIDDSFQIEISLYKIHRALFNYPLLFPCGNDGYRVDIRHRGLTSSSSSNRPNCTMREFLLILNSRRLFQCASYEHLRNVQDHGKTTFSNIGQRVILPSSFTGGACYMQQNYLDTMSLCKWVGYPDFFITITCNPKWTEIKRFLKDTNLKPEDMPAILRRIFKIKFDAMIKILREKNLFGKVQGVVYTTEFQKRGLPHSHICLFLHSDDKLRTIEQIDKYISADIPNINEDPDFYSLVSEFMMHGPCGAENMKCPCMVDNKCSKNFSKKFSNETSVDEDGFPIYRRRNDGSFVEKSGVKLDNRHVVAYNKDLLKRYQGHINVEWCNRTMKVLLIVQYISACKASWKNFGYDIHYRYPTAVRLPFHLLGQHQVIYDPDDDIDNILDKSFIASLMFTSWLECNKIYKQARNLTYVEYPTKFVWKTKSRKWKPREIGFSIGKIHVRVPTSFEDI
uniref:Helitron helicase-like domain-containing protein n=1 Tax=Lactuca sativa TaxID=4236 RepID=A0A9R1VWP7_LACSA|nr:hypothetical protein LSAT_V11C400224740 [Lactuca sativa]